MIIIRPLRIVDFHFITTAIKMTPSTIYRHQFQYCNALDNHHT